jgi:broad specificity phosphatase PhoE
MHYPPLYILRHGQTTWNAEQRIQGSLDSPLTSLGRSQALCQQRILSGCDLLGFTALSSPQERALETARIALDGLFDRIKTDNDLREIGVGAWEGHLRADLLSQAAIEREEEGALDLYVCAPEGEGFDALHVRCTAFLETLTGPAVLVTHGITSRMLRVILTGRSIDDLGGIDGGQGCVFHIKDGVQVKLTIGA